jgi:antitoxin component YwqK of YwqJK toxin-antitoxin module
MKAILIVILFFSFTLNAFGQIDSGITNKAEAKNLKVNGKKEGKWMEYIDDAEKIAKDSNKARYYHLAVYKSGKLNGFVRDYEKNGQLHSIGLYINDKENGYFTFYDSGRVVLSIPYVNGKVTGVAKFYSLSGDSTDLGMFEVPYIDGQRNGVEKAYYKNGKIMWEDTINNGKKQGIDIAYYESGKEKGEESWRNGKREGMGKEYYEDGKIKSETFYKNGKEGATKKYDKYGNEIK